MNEEESKSVSETEADEKRNKALSSPDGQTKSCSTGYYKKIKNYLGEPKALVEIITLVAVLVYTGITGWLLIISVSQIGLERQNQQTAVDTLHASQRPWVSIKSITFKGFAYAESDVPTVPATTNPSAMFNIQIAADVSNSGQSTAVYVLAGNARAKSDDETFLDAHCSNFEKSGTNVGEGVVLIPGQDQETALIYVPDSLPFKTIENYMAVFVCVVYEDQFSDWHYTQTCFASHPPPKGSVVPTFTPCGYGDDAD